MLGREGRRAIAVIGIGVILAACSSAAASIAASPSSTAIALPKIGDAVAVPGAGYTLTVIRTQDWYPDLALAQAIAQEQPFAAASGSGDFCHQNGDSFLALDLREEATSDQAIFTGVFFDLIEPGSLKGHVARYALNNVLCGLPAPLTGLPGPALTENPAARSGDVFEGWVVFPISDQLKHADPVLSVPGAPGAPSVHILLHY